ncbi:MAG: hypothetical protein JJE51_04080, partial [Thermoanaerobaculia bacterium]|nr:hypothetical protein [Thermoanaerobaculia bacterium]
IFYAARLWPEIPAAFFFVEAIRAVRQRRAKRWIPALLGMSLLKLRFLLVALPLTIRAVSRSKRQTAIAAVVIAAPLFIVWLITGSATNIHTLEELLPSAPAAYGRGLLGLIVDGAAGIAFQAPFYLMALFALLRWRSMPEAFRLGCFSALLYVIYLLPRHEWHGGWSPPLRYIVFAMPILALGAAALWERVARPFLWLIAAWTIGVVIHGVAHPWRLFHVANGENIVSEFLSRMYSSDFSRLFPSVIRWNQAATAAAAIVAITALVAITASVWRRAPSPAAYSPLIIPIAAILIAFAFNTAQKPASIVNFEDVHVTHTGGRLDPPEYTMARYYYQPGWILDAGDRLSFLATRGIYRLHYSAPAAVTIKLGSHAYTLEGTNNKQSVTRVTIDRTGRAELRCLTGALNLDRMERIE